jgi:hypothetical protein
MKARSAVRAGCGRARFWIRFVCSGNGNAYPGTLREGPAEKRVRVALLDATARSGVWLPRSDSKLGMVLQRHSPYLCMIERP